MLTPEEIRATQLARVNAIVERFQVEPSTNLQKSEDATQDVERVYTSEDLQKFKEDLFKGIDEGTLTEDVLEKAQQDLLSLERTTRTINGEETEVFVKR